MSEEDGSPEEVDAELQSDRAMSALHDHAELKAWMKERQVIAWERIADALEKIANERASNE